MLRFIVGKQSVSLRLYVGHEVLFVSKLIILKEKVEYHGPLKERTCSTAEMSAEEFWNGSYHLEQTVIPI